ncbi:hypothetical protein HOLleu_02262 [Holothuria leucospilota]|uniref:Uncharacterized protein n=1 Tax=Holothuria leucospilota TaxID=206669 RepID=A0A9Q1CRE0_HOLLE|nr:hypothetical protein HOLleu_02262 [Holothuria leucospilota]
MGQQHLQKIAGCVLRGPIKQFTLVLGSVLALLVTLTETVLGLVISALKRASTGKSLERVVGKECVWGIDVREGFVDGE